MRTLHFPELRPGASPVLDSSFRTVHPSVPKPSAPLFSATKYDNVHMFIIRAMPSGKAYSQHLKAFLPR
jgi:hypothetical protein